MGVAVTTVAVAGSTGSIGTQTIDVVRAEPDRFEIVALGAWSSVDALVAQAHELRPKLVVVGDEQRVAEVVDAVPPGTEVQAGVDGAGRAGHGGRRVRQRGGRLRRPAADAGHAARRAAAGPGQQGVADRRGPGGARGAGASPERAEIVPVDSEHGAVHQCLAANAGGDAGRVARIVLTASGGPFRGRTRAELADVTVDDALAHPTWSMGPKITVDSSTLMNKGLEVIEAHELFGDVYGIGYDDIEVVVHPQSIVHSMVELSDGSTIAQLSRARHAPAHRVRAGLARPHRHAVRSHRLGDDRIARPSSRPTSTPSRASASPTTPAGRAGWPRRCSTPPTRRPSAAFLAGRIAWSAIPDVLNAVLSRHDGGTADGVDAVIDADRRGRDAARRQIERIAA